VKKKPKLESQDPRDDFPRDVVKKFKELAPRRWVWEIQKEGGKLTPKNDGRAEKK